MGGGVTAGVQGVLGVQTPSPGGLFDLIPRTTPTLTFQGTRGGGSDRGDTVVAKTDTDSEVARPVKSSRAVAEPESKGKHGAQIDCECAI